jgi:hypothetical protein
VYVRVDILSRGMSGLTFDLVICQG